MSCFRFQKKTIQPPRGVGFPSRALPSLTNTACSATGCYGDLTRPFVKAPVDAKLRARSRAKAPVCMAWEFPCHESALKNSWGPWWGDGILGLPLTKTNSNVHTGIIHMIKIYIYITSMICIYIYTFSCVCTYKDWDIYLNLFIHSDLYMDQSVRSLALRFHATCIELSYLWLGGDSCHPR